VFEHLSDPLSDLKDLVQRLNPNGILFIDVPAPRGANISASLLLRNHEIFNMHEHITHFSRRSLARLVKAAKLMPLLEYTARCGSLFIVTAIENSEIANKLLPLKLARETYIETRIKRLS